MLRYRRTDYREDAQKYKTRLLTETQEYKERNNLDYYNNTRRPLNTMPSKTTNQAVDTLDQFRNSYVRMDEQQKENKRDSQSVGTKDSQRSEYLSYTEAKKPYQAKNRSIYNRELPANTTENVFPSNRPANPRPKVSVDEERFISNYARFYGTTGWGIARPPTAKIPDSSKEALRKLLYDKGETFFRYDILKNRKTAMTASDRKPRTAEVDINSKRYKENLERFWGMPNSRELVTNLQNTNGAYGRLFK